MPFYAFNLRHPELSMLGSDHGNSEIETTRLLVFDCFEILGGKKGFSLRIEKVMSGAKA